jgi:hypothetical protein
MYKRYIDNELSIGMLRKETVPMHEPTQESIVSVLRRRVRTSITDLMHVLDTVVKILCHGYPLRALCNDWVV